MKKIALALIFAGFVTSPVFACDQHGQSGIVEENDLFISIHDKNVSNVTKKDFNEVLDRVDKIYRPIISDLGKKLEVIRSWSNGTVNAYAQQTGNTWKISMFGGLARHETITKDAFALVACHEIGHHLGGLPKKSGWGGVIRWASNEGQADWFGNAKCLRKYMEADDNIAMMADVEVPAFATKKCQDNFTSAEDVAMCQRGAMAGLSLGNLFRALRDLDTELNFDTPDPNVVTRTNHNHPAPQCRVDTYFAGAICNISAYDDVSNSDVAIGVCVRSEGHTDGVRPLCWYKPEATN